MLGRLLALLALPITGPLDAVGWVAGQVTEAADREVFDPARVETALRRLEQQLEAGEITEDAFEKAEAEQLDLLAVIRARRAG
jgi:chorismate mutase